MEIYNTNNKNIFYTFIKIDNKEIELDFVLTVEDNFYCDIFIKTKENMKNRSYLTVQQYNFNKHDFVIPRKEFNKYITNRQIDLLKKEIKKAYMKILKIKYEEIIESENKMIIDDKKIDEYEKYRKYIDVMY